LAGGRIERMDVNPYESPQCPPKLESDEIGVFPLIIFGFGVAMSLALYVASIMAARST